MVREQQTSLIQDWLQDQCNRWNGDIEEILNIHFDTPDPSKPIIFSPKPFNIPEPTPPTPKSVDLLGKIFNARRKQILHENRLADEAYVIAHADWEKQRNAHVREQEAKTKAHTRSQIIATSCHAGVFRGAVL
jgi:hypothetical protein